VLIALGLDPALAAGAEAGSAKLADAETKAWMARYRHETR